MRSHVRTFIVLALAVALLVLFLYNVDLRGVAREIVRARPSWLLFSLATMFLNLALRAWRWQYLLEPLGRPSFANAFRATAVGFAASSILPARAGEFIRPYVLARHERMSATGAFATVILERVLDMLTVLVLLGAYVFFARPEITPANAVAYEAVKWAGATAAVGALGALAVMFVLAGNPARLAAALERLGHVLPSTLAALLARVAEKFASGLACVRRPGRLLAALALSLPLWLSIALGIWAVAVAFHLAISFVGSFLVIALLVVGVAVPTPGAVGGFHAAFKYAATTFFGASDDAGVGAAIVLHALTIGPQLALGLLFAAQEGLNVASMKRLADQAEPGSAVTP
jgi:uncharacterized protein (TIRG00374 family)